MNSNTATLTPEQAMILMQRYKETGCNDAATALLLYYHALMRMAASNLSRNRPDLFEDLFQVAQMSILRLFSQYDPAQQVPFEGYAMKSLIGHLKNYLRDKSWYIQMPRKLKEQGLQIQKVIDELTATLERSPSMDEIAARMSLTVEETIEVLAAVDSHKYVSLDTPLSAESDSVATLGDVIDSQVDEYRELEQRLDLKEAMKSLSKEEQYVLEQVYFRELSQRTIAEQLGISQMSVSRLVKRAIQKLNEKLS